MMGEICVLLDTYEDVRADNLGENFPSLHIHLCIYPSLSLSTITCYGQILNLSFKNRMLGTFLRKKISRVEGADYGHII